MAFRSLVRPDLKPGVPSGSASNAGSGGILATSASSDSESRPTVVQRVCLRGWWDSRLCFRGECLQVLQ